MMEFSGPVTSADADLIGACVDLHLKALRKVDFSGSLDRRTLLGFYSLVDSSPHSKLFLSHLSDGSVTSIACAFSSYSSFAKEARRVLLVSMFRSFLHGEISFPGLVRTLLFERRRQKASPDAAQLGMIIADPDRLPGSAKALLDAIQESFSWFRSLGFSEVSATTRMDNLRALSILKGVGFEVVDHDRVSVIMVSEI